MSIMDIWKRMIDKSIAAGENDDEFFNSMLLFVNKATAFANRRKNSYIRLLLISSVNPLRQAALYYFSKKKGR